MPEEKKTAGQQVLEHDARRLDFDDDIIEYRKSMEAELINNIHNTVAVSKNNTVYKGKDFYIVVLMSNDRVLRSPKSIVLARQSCPTPVYKQSVWKYHHASDSLEFLWSIPDSILYYHIVRNPSKYLNDKECADLAKFVLLMESGELLKWCKKENKEKQDAIIKINSCEKIDVGN